MSTIETYALDIDEELLSHLPDPNAWTVINGEGISDELINDDFVANVFNWQKQYIRQYKQPATIAILEDQFPNLQLESPETVIGDLLDRLRERYAKNQQREKFTDLQQLQLDNPHAVPDAMIRTGRELKNVLTKRGEVYGSGDVDRALHYYDKKVLQGPGASYGWKELNVFFKGMRGLNGVIGMPKSFKSWLLVQMLADNVSEGHPTSLFSLELPAVETDWRLRCLLANVPFWKYLHNKIEADERNRIREASEIIDDLGLYRIIKPPVGKRTIDDMVYQARDAGSEVILIDQLQYIETGDGINLGSHNNTGMYWNVLNKARDYSDEGPILYAHQFHRMNTNEPPGMEHAKGSSSIEETATLALGLWSDKQMRELNQIEAYVLCARNHQFASWNIQYDMKYGCSFDVIGRTDNEA